MLWKLVPADFLNLFNLGRAKFGFVTAHLQNRETTRALLLHQRIPIKTYGWGVMPAEMDGIDQRTGKDTKIAVEVTTFFTHSNQAYFARQVLAQQQYYLVIVPRSSDRPPRGTKPMIGARPKRHKQSKSRKALGNWRY